MHKVLTVEGGPMAARNNAQYIVRNPQFRAAESGGEWRGQPLRKRLTILNIKSKHTFFTLHTAYFTTK